MTDIVFKRFSIFIQTKVYIDYLIHLNKMNLNSITAKPAAFNAGFASNSFNGKMIKEDIMLYFLQNIILNKYYKPINKVGIIEVRKGTLEVKINNLQYSLSQGSIAYIPSNASFSMKSADSMLEGYIMILSDFFVESVQTPFLINLGTPFVIHNQDSANSLQNKFDQIFVLIKDEISNKEHIFQREKLSNLVSIFFIDILNAFAKQHSVSENLYADGKTTRGMKLTKDFINLVKLHSHNQRQINFYADKLCITPKYLSKLIKETSGISANEWITSTVIKDAKYLLKISGNSVKEVSNALNFPNQSFFGKYFKKKVGISPRDYQRAGAI